MKGEECEIAKAESTLSKHHPCQKIFQRSGNMTFPPVGEGLSVIANCSAMIHEWVDRLTASEQTSTSLYMPCDDEQEIIGKGEEIGVVDKWLWHDVMKESTDGR